MTIMRKYLTDSQQTQLLAHLKALASPIARRDRAWISLLMRTGMRIGEFSLFTVADAKFALRTGWIHIPKERRKGRRQAHEIPVTDAIRSDLTALLRLQEEFGGSGADDEPLVVSRERSALSPRSYEARIQKWAGNLNIRISPHGLRHTCAMNIMRRTTAEDPRGVVQKVLGHADIRSSGIYTELNHEEVRRCLEEAHGPRRLKKRDVARTYEGRVGA